jgi:hypothetical protein
MLSQLRSKIKVMWTIYIDTLTWLSAFSTLRKIKLDIIFVFQNRKPCLQFVILNFKILKELSISLSFEMCPNQNLQSQKSQKTKIMDVSKKDYLIWTTLWFKTTSIVLWIFTRNRLTVSIWTFINWNF